MSNGTLAAIILVVVALYWLDRRIFHRQTCRWCKGSGVWKSRLPFSRGERDCPRCGGARKTKRMGAGSDD